MRSYFSLNFKHRVSVFNIQTYLSPPAPSIFSCLLPFTTAGQDQCWCPGPAEKKQRPQPGLQLVLSTRWGPRRVCVREAEEFDRERSGQEYIL